MPTKLLKIILILSLADIKTLFLNVMKHMFILSGLVVMLFAISCKDEATRKSTGEEGDFLNTLTKQESEGARLTPELLWKFGRLGEMQPSPDGKTILYTVTRYDYKTDKHHTWIFSMPAAGGNPVNLTSGTPSCENPRWIDNSGIAYLSEYEGNMQIWKMKADGSDKTMLSHIKNGINGFELTKSGNQLFYLQDVKMDSTTQDKYPDLPLAKGRIIDDLMYRHWNAWHDYAYSHIFITSLENNQVAPGVDIMAGEPFDSPLSPYYEIEEIAWSPDGQKLAYTCKKLTGRDFAVSTNSDIYVYDLAHHTTKDITPGMMGYDMFPVFSPDGKKIAFQSMKTPGYESDQIKLWVYDFDTDNRSCLTNDFDQNATNYVWSADGSKIYFISGIRATFQVFECSRRDGSIRQITTGRHDYNSLYLCGDKLAGMKTTMSMASEIFSIDPANGVETQLTFVNKNIYDVVKMGRVDERLVKTTDGKNMLVWVVYPPDFDSTRKYPALLYCQGGPQSAVSQFFSYRWNLQLMAANGYIVVAPNRRGLPSFGQEWNAQISGDYGGQNIKDYLSAIDDIKKEPYVDANRLGAVGASYGGYSVLYLAGCHQKRFKVFIAHCGMFNLESQSAATEEMFFVHHDLGSYYWDKPKPKSFTQFSPHLYVDKWDTPIMLVTGANDFRIPYTESFQAFNVARLRGIPSKLLFFPDEGHWVVKPQNSILWQREFFGWLDKWLK
jgi:dipeptidyl aminopeptidase/acylaminoacyl peptidase